MKYLATINVPGYMPMDDDPPVFDTAKQAWRYLFKERESAEDCFPLDSDGLESGEYSDTWTALRYIAYGEHKHGNRFEDWPTNPDGTGVVYGDTPGYIGDHDLGLAYHVSLMED